MISNKIRTRFAPSPSGVMHIGNLRSALMSFLCAKENSGSFILRIEDTDKMRIKKDFISIIFDILNIMNLFPDEGPLQEKTIYGSYFQSERTDYYNKYLALFLEKNLVYRCFKTVEELEDIRNKQIVLKQPPRYVRTILSVEEENAYLQNNKPFVWRLNIGNAYTVIHDKVKGKIQYNLSHFSDCPITRQDHSYTFLFANFVDDVEMHINYVMRGEEHLSNTAIQSYMYDVLNLEKPMFYHLPLICDQEGKKLSKRNFGFNVYDILAEGYLPEAILNYIAIIGNNFKSEIMSLQEMIENKVFLKTHSSGFIMYDIEKLLWINMKWMQKIDMHVFIERLKLYQLYNETVIIPKNKDLILDLKKESKTIKEFFLNVNSVVNGGGLTQCSAHIDHKAYIAYLYDFIQSEKEEFLNFLLLKEKIKYFSLQNAIEEKKLYTIFRTLLINKPEGISIGILLKYINRDMILKKINSIK